MKRYSRKNSGITLVEVLVALALSLIILAGIMHIFLSNRQTYRVQEAFARIQENGRFAMQFIAKDLRMAGYVGCSGKINSPRNMADLYPTPNGDNVADIVGDFTGSGIEGYQTADLPLAISDTVNLTVSNVVPGTDIVRVKRASTTGARLAGNTDANNGQIQLDITTALGLFQADDYLFISDCEKSDIFVANNVSANTGSGKITIAHSSSENLNMYNNKLSKIYQDDAEVFKFSNNVYYIGNNSAGVPSLFRQSLANAGNIENEELVEGVEDMQILYGEDTDNNNTPDLYVDSASVTDWDNITAVRIELQIRSIEDNLSKKITAYGDKKLRRTFTTSIAIRNRTI